jgi:phytol kinase
MEIPKGEYWRKSLHLAWGLALPVLFWNRFVFSGLFALVLAAYLSVEIQGRRGRRIPFLSPLTERAKRESERGRLSWGAVLLALSGMLLPHLFGETAAAVGLSQTLFADVASSLVGMRWGKRKLPHAPTKSWIGSFAFLIAAFAVTAVFVPAPQAALLALIGTAVESLPIPEADNLTVPLAVGLAARLLWHP